MGEEIETKTAAEEKEAMVLLVVDTLLRCTFYPGTGRLAG